LLVACSSPHHAAPVCERIVPSGVHVDDAEAIAIVRRQCVPCHDAGGIAHHDFTTMAALRAAPVAEMIGTCQMPPDGQAPLSLAERRRLVEWSTSSGE
jgi:hypothetical protein